MPFKISQILTLIFIKLHLEADQTVLLLLNLLLII
jgi:hypothetical protein